MAATVRVLATHGFQGASADAIAREAGVSKGLLWHHFGNQYDLMRATAFRTVAILRHTVGETLDLDAPVPNLIRNAVHGAAGLRSTHQAERHAMAEILANLRAEDGSPAFSLADYAETYDAQEAIFRRGQEEGDIRADLDPLLLAVTYQGAVDSMLAYLDAYPDTDARAHADLVADVLLDGCRTHT